MRVIYMSFLSFIHDFGGAEHRRERRRLDCSFLL